MPYNSISDAKSAGFPTSAEGIDLTLSQINKLARIYDAIKAGKKVDNPMAVAWTQWKKLYSKSGDQWSANSEHDSIPEGYEPSSLAFHQPAALNYTEDARTGDTVFHDVILLAEGTWTDGHNRKPIHYSAKELSKMKIEKRNFKANHDIFGQLPITNEIGIIENEKYVTHPTPRWVGDVRIFPTQNGNDVITLLKRGAIKDISSELFSIHAHSKEGKTEATDILFMGAASVRTGACSVCTFNEGVETMTEQEAAQSGADSSTDENAEVAVLTKALQDEKDTDLKRLTAELEEAKKLRVNQTDAQLFAANQKIAELEAQNAEILRRFAALEHQKKAAELQKQIDELKATPIIHTRIESSPGPQRQIAELDSGEFYRVYSTDME